MGFRPLVHLLATARKLVGSVRNESGGLVIDVQGKAEVLDDFVKALKSCPPPLAVISHIRSSRAEVTAMTGFSIVDQRGAEESSRVLVKDPFALAGRTFVSPDIATCAECLAELFNSADRRYLYPFINCTHCGPRLTIIADLPYNRSNTTMRGFRMCDLCRREYEDPSNRRFHAQPIACPGCGPEVKLTHTGSTAESLGGKAITDSATLIASGGILAVKGLGGYHIACDATNADAIRLLRKRKNREARPLALMIAGRDAVSELCDASIEELELLHSRERPIVLLRRKTILDKDLRSALDEVAPGNGRLGVMLPYTPLHHILMQATRKPLVMTSGNLSDEPIAFRDDDASSRLAPIVDAILSHNRPISTRCDDSVMVLAGSRPAFLRRSRGFAPRPITTALSFPFDVLAVGGQLKNTFCLARGSSAFVSHHIGDLSNAAARESLLHGIRHYAALTGVEPRVVVHDLHPDYASTRVAAEMGIERRVAVQHHHAHVASCMAEHGIVERVIGVVFDGAGLGGDGAIWGGEFLLVDRAGYQRVGHLGYVPLPGGDGSVRRPIRMALSHLWNAIGDAPGQLSSGLTDRLSPGELLVLRQMHDKKINSPPTSSVGRLFDAVASLAGLRDIAQFEGQAAMELEAIADIGSRRSYPVKVRDVDSLLVPDPGPIIRAVVDDVRTGVAAGEISAAFHNCLARMILDVTEVLRQRTGINRIVLSGGVFQNVLLVSRSVATLERVGFEVFTQQVVPCNDGGLSLGQAYVVALAEGGV